jgi:hypothetical protein
MVSSAPRRVAPRKRSIAGSCATTPVFELAPSLSIRHSKPSPSTRARSVGPVATTTRQPSYAASLASTAIGS